MSTPSPTCLIGGSATPQDVGSGASVSGALANTAGVGVWFLQAIGVDDATGTAGLAAINASLSINQINKTFTFTAPTGLGRAVIFMSTVGVSLQSSLGQGRDVNGVVQASYTTTFKVNVKASNGLRVITLNEILEQDPNFGWINEINAVIRAAGSASVTWGSDLAGNGTSTNTNQYVSSLSFSSAAGGGTIAIKGTGTQLQYAATCVSPGLTQAQAVSGAGATMSIFAQSSASGSVAQGGALFLGPGLGDGGALPGTVFIGQNSGVAGNVQFFNTSLGTGSPQGILGLANATTVPTSVPSGSTGVTIWATGGTTLALGASNLFFASFIAAPLLGQVQATSGAGVLLKMQAQAAASGSNQPGGDVDIVGGIGDGSGAVGSVLLGATVSNVQMFWAGGAKTFGGGLGVLGIGNGIPATAAPSGGCSVGHDSLGLHYTGPSTSFSDYMLAPVEQGTANSQQNKSRLYSGVVRTTDTTATVLLTIPLATSSTNGAIWLMLTGRDVTSGTVNDGFSLAQLIQFKNNAGTVTLATTNGSAMTCADTSMNLCSVTYVVSGTNILIKVNGLSSVTIDWYGEARAFTN